MRICDRKGLDVGLSFEGPGSKIVVLEFAVQGLGFGT
jgi:hypothetical protein